MPLAETLQLSPMGAHSVAVDASNNLIFVPMGANNVYPNCLTGCIAVYGRPATVQ
jgi:hypothetical protein